MQRRREEQKYWRVKLTLWKKPKVFISSTLFFNIFIYLIPGLYIMIPRRVTVSYICPYIFRSLIPVLIVSSRRMLSLSVSYILISCSYIHLYTTLYYQINVLTFLFPRPYIFYPHFYNISSMLSHFGFLIFTYPRHYIIIFRSC